MTARHEQITPGAATSVASAVAGAVPMLMTRRLTLQAPRIADFPLYAEIAASDRSAGIGGPMTRNEAWSDWIGFSSGWLLHGHGGWSVVETATGEALGIVCVSLEPGDREVELGYIFSRQAEGRGMAFEAASAARDWAFEVLGLTSLVSYTSPDNARSAALAERLGATRDAAAEAKWNGEVHVYRHPNARKPARRNSDVLPTQRRHEKER